MSLNPLNEVKYGYRLAVEHLERAERSYSLRDWVGVMSSSQLSVENFAKAIIAVFEVPTWSHDPSNQLSGLIEKLPSDTIDDIKELISSARELAPEHGRSTYGEPSAGLVPSDIYEEAHASSALEKGRRARSIVEKVLLMLKIKL